MMGVIVILTDVLLLLGGLRSSSVVIVSTTVFCTRLRIACIASIVLIILDSLMKASQEITSHSKAYFSIILMTVTTQS